MGVNRPGDGLKTGCADGTHPRAEGAGSLGQEAEARDTSAAGISLPAFCALQPACTIGWAEPAAHPTDPGYSHAADSTQAHCPATIVICAQATEPFQGRF